RKIVSGYGKLISRPQFVGFAVGGGCVSISLYAFIAAAPFIFINQLHRTSSEVGIYLALTIVGGMCGSLAASRLSGRIGGMRVKGNCISLVAAGAFLVAAISGHLSVPLVVGAMFVYSFGATFAS